jgi:hypothetical protein
MARIVMAVAIPAVASTAIACGASTTGTAAKAGTAGRRPYRASCINQPFTAFVLVVRPAGDL